jgi:hypothetical protein
MLAIIELVTVIEAVVETPYCQAAVNVVVPSATGAMVRGVA